MKQQLKILILRTAFMITLFVLSGCQKPCHSDAWVFRTQGKIILGHTTELSLCPNGRFLMDIESDVHVSFNGKRIDPIYQGEFTIEPSDHEDFNRKVILIFDDSSLRSVYYLARRSNNTYLLREDIMQQIGSTKVDSNGFALKLK